MQVTTQARSGSAAIPAWLRIIHEVNRAKPGTFGVPTFTESPDGERIEVYPDFSVTFDADGATVTIRATTPHGETLLGAATQGGAL